MFVKYSNVNIIIYNNNINEKIHENDKEIICYIKKSFNCTQQNVFDNKER